MLQFIRDHATGWVAWGIVLLICVPFALWGIYDYLGPNPNVSVATVNGSEISLQQYRQAYQSQQAQLQAAFGVGANSPLLNQDRLRAQVIENLVDDELVLQSGTNAGMRIGDGQLASAIQSQSIFRAGNNFSQEQYEQWLRRQGYSPGGFEFNLRRSMLNEQIINGLARSAIVTDRDRNEAVRLADQTRSFSQLRLTESPEDGPAIEPAVVEAHFAANKLRYRTDDEVRIAYIEVSRDSIARIIEADETQLRALYEQQKLNYTSPARREARHILIQVAKDADEAELSAARARIDTLREQLNAGTDFAGLAEEHSDDPGSASKGGALGFFGRGIMAPPFEEAAFSLAVGEISEPVKTTFGWHLIEVTGIEEARVRTFDEARGTVLKEFQRMESEQVFAEQVEQLANLAFEHPESLEVAADALGLEIESTGFFGRAGGDTLGVSDEPAVIDAAFDNEVLIDGNNSQPIELGSRVLVLRTSEFRPARPQALEEVREAVRSQLRREAADERVIARGIAMVRQLRNGADIDEIADAEGLSWSMFDDVPRPVGRGDQVISTVFRTPKPESGRPVFDGIALGDGGYVVIALRAVTEGEAKSETEGKSASPGARLATGLGFGEYNSYVRALRGHGKVVIAAGQL